MDFLTFKSFISTDALIVFYYIGAIILPVVIWYMINWLVRKYAFLDDALKEGKIAFFYVLSKRQRIKLTIIFFTIFLFLELFWRMLFEFLIAYMQIRDALVM